MPKSSRKQMDIDEKKIIAELQVNAKESIDKIAENCGFSRQKVWRVIKRLEKNKTIWGYHAVVDDEKLDLKRYLILIKRTNKPLSKEKLDLIVDRKIKQKITKLGVNLVCSYCLHGAYDWFMCITAESIREVKKFTENLNNLFNDYISDFQIEEVIFPVETSCVTNPNIKRIEELFLFE